MTDTTDRRQATQVLKQLARELLDVDDETIVMVTELQCTEPGCPPIETVIAVLRVGAREQIKIHKPLAEVTRDDVVAALRVPHAH